MRNKTNALLVIAGCFFIVFESFAQTNSFRLGDGVRGPMNTGGSIAVFLNNAQPVVGMQFTLVNKPALLSVSAVRAGERASAVFDVVDFNNLSGDTIKVLAMNADGTGQLEAGEGEILQIDFNLQASAPPGTIPLDITELFLIDVNGQLIPTIAQGSTFFDPQVTDFLEVSKAAGFDEIFSGALGSAWADYDLDGDQDLLYFSDFTTLLRNNSDGTFTHVGEESGIQSLITNDPLFDKVSSAIWGDYDNDGDPDAFFLGEQGGRSLLENNGDGTFKDVTTATLLPAEGEDVRSYANWIDFNSDGNLDIFISDGSLFQNSGNKTFVDISSNVNLETLQNGGSAWADYDNDGDLDLFSPARIYRNDAGSFVDVSNITGISLGGFGMAIGDYDNDGYLDLYLTRDSFMPASLYKNNGNGTFTDVTALAGVSVENSHGAAWGDMDNDGDLDLIVTRPLVRHDPYRLFRNNNDGTFTNIHELADVVIGRWIPGADPGQSASWADFNNDGKLDLFIANETYPDFLFQNHGNGTGNHFLVLTLVGTTSNKSAIGARVTVEAGGIPQIREVEGGANTSQNSLPVEFGLGQAQQVDKITIRWPSGLEESTTRPVRQVDTLLVVQEGELHVVGVEDRTGSKIPISFNLFQNYPNPFNPATTIQYQLPKAQHVIVKIYNAMGQEVRTLVDEAKQAGIYKIEWDGKSRQGRAVSTGLYIVRMEAGEFTKSKKIVLLK